MILRGRREEVVVHSETERRGAEGVELGVGLGEVESGVVVDETDLFWEGGPPRKWDERGSVCGVPGCPLG